MAEVFAKDILFRAGGATLKRLQTLCSAGGSRIEVAHTFTRTCKRPLRDRDGNSKVAASGIIATDWPSGLVDASGNPIGGPYIGGVRTQLVTDPENFAAWTVSGTPVLTSGQADPFGGTAAYLIGDDSAAAGEFILQTLGAFTGDGVKAIAAFVAPFTGGLTQRIKLFDAVAAADRINVNITWSGGVPTPAVTVGTLLSTEGPYPNGFYRIGMNSTSVTAANAHNIRLLPTSSNVADVGSHYFFGVNAWNVPFVSPYQGPAIGTAAAEALTSPFNFGPQDITILVRLGRPNHADVSGALGISPGIFSLGAGSAARIGAYFDPAARNIVGVIDTATTDQTVSAAIPAGNPTVLFQFKNLTTGGQVAIDTGSGLSAFSSAATAFSAFSSQTLRIGRYDDELYGVIGDLIIARGLRTRAEMLAIDA